MVVDHLHGEAGSSTVYANWPFTIYSKSSIDRKRLGRVWPDHNPVIIANGSTFQHVPFISEIFLLVDEKLSRHLHSDRDFRNFWISGKQSMCTEICGPQ